MIIYNGNILHIAKDLFQVNGEIGGGLNACNDFNIFQSTHMLKYFMGLYIYIYIFTKISLTEQKQVQK